MLVTGHTHKFDALEHDGYFYINPGSITGAFTPLDGDVRPSFLLLDVQQTSIVTHRAGNFQHRHICKVTAVR